MKKIFLSLAIIFNSLFLLQPVAVGAQATKSVCDSIRLADPTAPCDEAGSRGKVNSVLQTILQTFVYVVGIISVLVIVIGGLMYVTSAGDPNNTKRAKDAILYAIIGLIVALLAQVIVSFVLNRIG